MAGLLLRRTVLAGGWHAVLLFPSPVAWFGVKGEGLACFMSAAGREEEAGRQAW